MTYFPSVGCSSRDGCFSPPRDGRFYVIVGLEVGAQTLELDSPPFNSGLLVISV